MTAIWVSCCNMYSSVMATSTKFLSLRPPSRLILLRVFPSQAFLSAQEFLWSSTSARNSMSPLALCSPLMMSNITQSFFTTLSSVFLHSLFSSMNICTAYSGTSSLSVVFMVWILTSFSNNSVSSCSMHNLTKLNCSSLVAMLF